MLTMSRPYDITLALRGACAMLIRWVHAGRARSRNSSRHKLDYQDVLDALKTKGIAIR